MNIAADGSSSAAPVIKPGPSSEKKRRTRPCLPRATFVRHAAIFFDLSASTGKTQIPLAKAQRNQVRVNLGEHFTPLTQDFAQSVAFFIKQPLSRGAHGFEQITGLV
jgi:hypothetical protein